MNKPWVDFKLGNYMVDLPKSTLQASHTDARGNYDFFCSSSVPKKSHTWLIEQPAILMGTGGVASVHYGSGRFAYSTDTWAFKIRQDECLLHTYAYRVLEHSISRIDYAGFEGSGLRHLRKDFIRKLVFKAPANLSEQQKIAAILASIDTAIEKTEALIEKYQQIKAGLMHDLFTRGVLPSGQLRPPREQAPELYQETSIGWFPKEWRVYSLESLLAPVANNVRSGPFGSALLKHELVENGAPFLGIDNIFVERFEADFKRFVSENKFNELSRYKTRPNDVLITIMGTVGRSCVIPAFIERALSSKHLWTMTFDNKKVIPELICWQLNHADWAKTSFRRAAQGGVMEAIQSSTLKKLLLPTPRLDEQELIYKRYDKISERIRHEEKQVEKLKKQKNGLMQDLLTGKVQVTPPAESTING